MRPNRAPRMGVCQHEERVARKNRKDFGLIAKLRGGLMLLASATAYTALDSLQGVSHLRRPRLTIMREGDRVDTLPCGRHFASTGIRHSGVELLGPLGRRVRHKEVGCLHAIHPLQYAPGIGCGQRLVSPTP